MQMPFDLLRLLLLPMLMMGFMLATVCSNLVADLGAEVWFDFVQTLSTRIRI